MGSENASMPMKCIDQMPLPIAMAPPACHRRAEAVLAAASRIAGRQLNAVYETENRDDYREAHQPLVVSTNHPLTPCEKGGL